MWAKVNRTLRTACVCDTLLTDADDVSPTRSAHFQWHFFLFDELWNRDPAYLFVIERMIQIQTTLYEDGIEKEKNSITSSAHTLYSTPTIRSYFWFIKAMVCIPRIKHNGYLPINTLCHVCKCTKQLPDCNLAEMFNNPLFHSTSKICLFHWKAIVNVGNY